MRGLLVWLEGTAVATAMREWTWLYPLVETLHILSFVVLVGAAAMFDLRLLGASPGLSVKLMARHLLPWARAGLACAVPTGLLLFATDATTLATNPALGAKLTALVLAIVNAQAFHRRTYKGVAAWDHEAATPPAAKLAAVASLVLWAAVVALGRLIAYV